MRFFGNRPSRPHSRPTSRRGSGDDDLHQAVTAKQAKDVQVHILVNNHGCIRMNQQEADEHGVIAHGQLSGEIEIRVARGSGRKRCRAIRVSLCQWVRLQMGPKRGWEKDLLFQRSIENRGAIILEEGVQRFRFNIAVPWGLAAFDIHPRGDIRLSLVAEVHGLSSGASLSPPAIEEIQQREYLKDLRRGSRSSGSSVQTEETPLTTPEELDGPPGGVIRPLMTVSWNDPVSGSDEEVPWMNGNAGAIRCVCLLYNPDPQGGVTSLYEPRDGDVPGLGLFETRLISDVWTVSALLKTSVNIPTPSPAAAIYYMCTVLEQTASITSPRDPEDTTPIVTMTPFPIWEKGVRPGKTVTKKTPTLWRGRDAGGPDLEGLAVSGVGRLPNDETGRPSTLFGVITPINVTHKLVINIYYSVEGEDVHGRKLPKGTPPQVRLLRIDKPVFLPSCGCIPETLDLPTYGAAVRDCFVCPTCGLTPNEQVCRACDLGSLLHPRHDLSQFGPNGICPECDKRFLQSDEKSKWADCACGLDIKDMMQRMARCIPDEVESVGDCTTDLPFKLDISA